MSEESREQRWARLIDEERTAFERAQRNAQGAGPDRRANLTRDWFAASARLLMAHAVVHEGGPLEHPWEAIGRAAKLMKILSTGNLPDPVKYVTGAGGRPGRSPGLCRDIAVALHYIELVGSKKIQDGHPIVTVGDAFRVPRTTVQAWQRGRDAICEGTHAPSADSFPEVLREAGDSYHFNRPGTQQAIATALRYIALARSGEVQDHQFIGTVAEAFQVECATVQEWDRNAQKILAGIPREILGGIPETPPGAFPDALRAAGDRYHSGRANERT